jgi:thymidylate kinase
MSAWIYGKAKAEEKSASTLPRQGTNKNVISSLFRFGYYLLDFLLGQFVIWVRYTLPGHVVLYDRYYFDFIEDPKRSNIALPRWFCAFFYRFIFKPNINIFLHAQPESILTRKKELSIDDIVKLTSGYKKLFKEYSKKYNGKYVAIENESLEKTLEHIESLFVTTA